ncbi:hypothetical protein ACFZDP_25780 [Streptomyces mirabilis]|uniref:hypothetical protein n=1 Tax=Streptomyces mirabilis TaxID=68239 RepID=UPI0036E89D27
MAILLPPVLGIMLIALAWPDGGRLAVNTAAVVLGVPYAARLVAGAAAPLARSGYIEAATARGERLWYLALRDCTCWIRVAWSATAPPPSRCPSDSAVGPWRSSAV